MDAGETDACRQAIRDTVAYIAKKSTIAAGGWGPFFAVAEACIRDIDAAAVAGDLAATQAACRRLWTDALAYVPAQA